MLTARRGSVNNSNLVCIFQNGSTCKLVNHMCERCLELEADFEGMMGDKCKVERGRV